MKEKGERKRKRSKCHMWADIQILGEGKRRKRRRRNDV